MNHVRSSLYSRRSAAAYLGIAERTLANWASSGRYGLPYVRIGRRAMYRRDDLDAFVSRRLVNAREPSETRSGE